MKHFYPNGTIVTLKNNETGEKEKVMIVGRGYRNSKINGIIDYMGFFHPYGFVGVNHNVTFAEEAIEEVLFLGYSDSAEKEYQEILKKSYEKNN